MTGTLAVPGAVLTYDVRPGTDPTTTPLVMVASPMAAAGFNTLAGHFTDRTVITYDPRHSERSTLTSDQNPTPDVHADDIHRVIRAAVGDAPIDVFASSGGAVNMLAFVAARPDAVRTLVVHEPPLASALPDRESALAAVLGIDETYRRDGLGHGMARFIALVMHRGEVPVDWADQPAPDPEQFGLPTEDDDTRDDPMLGYNHMISVTHYEPDYDAVRAAPTRVVVGVGQESEGEIAHRGGQAVAERLGVRRTVFPSGHGGFLGGEYGQTGDPEAFAQTLRQTLDTQETR